MTCGMFTRNPKLHLTYYLLLIKSVLFKLLTRLIFQKFLCDQIWHLFLKYFHVSRFPWLIDTAVEPLMNLEFFRNSTSVGKLHQFSLKFGMTLNRRLLHETVSVVLRNLIGCFEIKRTVMGSLFMNREIWDEIYFLKD